MNGKDDSSSVGARGVTLLALVAHCAAAIFLFSSQDDNTSHVMSDDVVSLVAPLGYDKFDQLDEADCSVMMGVLDKPVCKVAHSAEHAALGMAAFAALGALFPAGRVARTDRRASRRMGSGRDMSRGSRVRLVLLACFAYSCTDESHQLFSPNRTARFSDCVIGTCGAAVGIMIACGVSALLGERRGRGG